MLHRVFLAVNLPMEIKNELENVVEQLKLKNKHLNIKWVEKENFHFTLYFIGYLEERKLSMLEDRLQAIKFEKFNLVKARIGKLLYFPHKVGPRVIARELIFFDNSLVELHQYLREVLLSFGIPVDDRLFRPHITLGRVKSYGTAQDNVVQNQEMDFSIRTFDLMESYLNASGPKYKILKKYEIVKS